MELGQLEHLCSGNNPRCLMITHAIGSNRISLIPSQNYVVQGI